MPRKKPELDYSDPGEKPWSIQPGETETRYAAFQDYLRQDPPRNLRVLAESLGKTPGQIRSYSSKHKWVSRARAYESWLAEQMAETDAEEKKRLRREHLRALEKARWIAENRLAAIVDDPELLDGMSPKDILAFLKESVTLERLIVGEATSRAEDGVKIDLSPLADEEIDQLEALHSKARGEE